MRYLFLLLLIFPLAVNSQECNILKKVDQFSQENLLSTGFMHFSGEKGEKVSLTIEADSREIRLLFSAKGNCFNDQSKAVFVFDGSKSKSTQKNTAAMNCDGIFTIVFRNTSTTPFALKKIATQKATYIELNGSNNQKIMLTLTDEQKAQLVEKANCLVEESKSLRTS